MKHSRIILIILLFITSFPVSSQNEEISWGQEIKMKGVGEASIIGSNEDSYFVHHKDRNGEHVLQFDFDHELMAEVHLEDQYGRRDLSITSMINIPEGDYFLMKEQRIHKQNGVGYLVKWEDGDFGALNEIGISDFTGLLLNKYSNLIDVSSNEQFIVICSTFEADGNGDHSYKVQLYNSSLSLQWESIWNHEEYEDVNISQLVVDDKGRVYILSNYTIDQRYIPSKERSYIEERQVVSFWPEGAESLVNYEVTLSGSHRPVDMGIVPVLEKDELILTGFYRKDEKDSKRQEGVFQQTISLSAAEILDEHLFPHEESALGQLLEKDTLNLNYALVTEMKRSTDGKTRAGRMSRRDISHDDFTIRKLISFEDGTFSILAESIHGAKTKSTEMLYYAGRLLWLVFSPQKDEIFPTVIQRDYFTRELPATSFIDFFGEEGAYLIFNDNKTKREVEASEAQGQKLTRVSTDLLRLDMNSGDIEQQPLINVDMWHPVIFHPILSKKTNNGILFMMQDGSHRSYKVGFLALE